MLSLAAKLFIGHLVIGALFFILGTWWAIGAWHAYSLRRHQKGYCDRRAYFVHPGIKPKCIEGFYKMAFGTSGAFLFVWILMVNRLYQDGTTAQHLSMCLFIFLNGAFDLLTHYKVLLPLGLDYVSLLMCLCVEALLFCFHLHGRRKVDVLVHTLHVVAVMSEAACVALEMVWRRSVLATLGRAFFGILQGTWLCHIAFILYNQLPGALPWEDDHQTLMVVAAVFTWHGLGVLLYIGLIGALVSMGSKKCRHAGWGEDVHSALLPVGSSTAKSCGDLDSCKMYRDFENDENRGA